MKTIGVLLFLILIALVFGPVGVFLVGGVALAGIGALIAGVVDALSEVWPLAVCGVVLLIGFKIVQAVRS
jgi:hypothetical protein